MLRVNVDTSDYDVKISTMRNVIPDLIPEFVKESADIVFDNFQKNTPVKTGDLKNSEVKEVEKTSALIYTTSGYGKFVDEDTKAHKIRAKEGGFLRFEIGGTVFFRKEVNHPGTTGQHFKAKTLDDSRDPILARIIQIYRSRAGSK